MKANYREKKYQLRCHWCSQFLSKENASATLKEPNIFYCPKCYKKGLEMARLWVYMTQDIMKNKDLKKKWFRVEYFTTLEPPKTIEDIDDRYSPKGLRKDDRVDDIKVFKL